MDHDQKTKKQKNKKQKRKEKNTLMCAMCRETGRQTEHVQQTAKIIWKKLNKLSTASGHGLKKVLAVTTILPSKRLRERETETETDRQTDRQKRERETETETERQRETQRDRGENRRRRKKKTHTNKQTKPGQQTLAGRTARNPHSATPVGASAAEHETQIYD